VSTIGVELKMNIIYSLSTKLVMKQSTGLRWWWL